MIVIYMGLHAICKIELNNIFKDILSYDILVVDYNTLDLELILIIQVSCAL